MSWHATKTWAVGDNFTVFDANHYLRDDMQYNRDTYRLMYWLSKDFTGWVGATTGAWEDFGGDDYVKYSNVVKRQASSSFRIRYSGSASSTGSPMNGHIGVLIGGTDYEGAPWGVDAADEHRSFFGLVQIDGLAAGTYTVILRCKGTGTAAFQTSIHSGVSMEIFEVSNV